MLNSSKKCLISDKRWKTKEEIRLSLSKRRKIPLLKSWLPSILKNTMTSRVTIKISLTPTLILSSNWKMSSATPKKKTMIKPDKKWTNKKPTTLLFYLLTKLMLRSRDWRSLKRSMMSSCISWLSAKSKSPIMMARPKISSGNLRSDSSSLNILKKKRNNSSTSSTASCMSFTRRPVSATSS